MDIWTPGGGLKNTPRSAKFLPKFLRVSLCPFGIFARRMAAHLSMSLTVTLATESSEIARVKSPLSHSVRVSLILHRPDVVDLLGGDNHPLTRTVLAEGVAIKFEGSEGLPPR